jgi:hypothetical protein
LPKPRRRHLTIPRIEQSAPGRAFLAELAEALGRGAGYVPVAYEGGWHTFFMRGELGEAFVRDEQERAVEGCWVSRVEASQRRWTPEGSGVWTLSVTTNRPDAAIGWPGPPAGLSKRAQRLWWDAETARVGDERDTVEVTFVPDEEPVPLALEDALMLMRVVGCSMCEEPAARIAHVPVGHELPWLPMPQDMSRARLFIDLGGPMKVWTASDDDVDVFEHARYALSIMDVPLLAELNEAWTPFWCRACERTYCLHHFDDEDRCPHGHARATWDNAHA